MKTIDIQNKEFKQSFRQVRNWFKRNPNRKTVRLRTNKLRFSNYIIAQRDGYIKK